MRMHHVLKLGLLLMIVWSNVAQADDLPVTQVSFYQGINLINGQKEFVPDVLTLIVNPSERVQWVLSPDTEEELFRFSDTIDLYFGYDPSAAQPIRVTPAHLSGLAVLPETDVETVDEDTVKHLPLTMPPAAVTVGSGDTVVARTVDHRYVVFGRVTRQSDWTITFASRTLSSGTIPTPVLTATPSVPEPSTLLLFGFGGIGLIGMMRRIKHRKYNHTQGGHFMTRIFFFMVFSSLCLPLTGKAALLTVALHGTGEGIVMGDGIECCIDCNDCTETYPDETIVHLRAYPYEGSEFIGWLLDGIPQEGALIVRKDMIVTALFNEKKHSPVQEFETVKTQQIQIDSPLFDSRGSMVGSRKIVKEGNHRENIVTLFNGNSFKIEPLEQVIVSKNMRNIIAAGDYIGNVTPLQAKMVVSIYDVESGKLIQSIDSGVRNTGAIICVEDTGEFLIAGNLFEESNPCILRRYSSQGELIWTMPLPNGILGQFSLSPDGQYVALLFEEPYKERKTIQYYTQRGDLVYEQDIPKFFYGITFISEQLIIAYSSDEWQMFRIGEFQSPIFSSRFIGFPKSERPIFPAPQDRFFLLSTLMGEPLPTSLHLQAIHYDTGEVLAERMFDDPNLIISRINEKGLIEVLIENAMVFELKIPYSNGE